MNVLHDYQGRMTPHELGFWAAVYNTLNEQHDLWHGHGVTWDVFIADPEHYNHWIRIYFANSALLIHRHQGGRVLLSVFLLNPALCLLSAMERANNLRYPDVRELLPKQSVAAAMVLWTDSPCGRHGQLRGNRYVQALKPHGHECIGKYKTRGGHRKATGRACG